MSPEEQQFAEQPMMVPETYMPPPMQFQAPQPNPLGWTKDTLNQIINRRDPAQDIMDSLKGIHRDAGGNIVFDYIIEIDEQTGKPVQVPIPPKPLMNSEGLEAFAALLKSTLSQNAILTNFSKKNVNDHCMSIVEAAIFDLENNYRKYGIEDTSQMDRIVTIVMVSVHAALLSGEEGFTMNHVTGMYQKVDRPQEDRKPGLFGSVGGR